MGYKSIPDNLEGRGSIHPVIPVETHYYADPNDPDKLKMPLPERDPRESLSGIEVLTTVRESDLAHAVLTLGTTAQRAETVAQSVFPLNHPDYIKMQQRAKYNFGTLKSVGLVESKKYRYKPVHAPQESFLYYPYTDCGLKPIIAALATARLAQEYSELFEDWPFFTSKTLVTTKTHDYRMTPPALALQVLSLSITHYEADNPLTGNNMMSELREQTDRAVLRDTLTTVTAKMRDTNKLLQTDGKIWLPTEKGIETYRIISAVLSDPLGFCGIDDTNDLLRYDRSGNIIPLDQMPGLYQNAMNFHLSRI
jgi:hypothetical protein